MREMIDLIIAELRGSWRFRWQAMLAAWLICIGGWLFVYALPDSYESEAMVLIDTTSDLGPLLQTLTVNTDVLTRVEMVRVMLLGRRQLQRVARETDLYLRARTDLEADELILGLRSRITISSDRRQANVYQIRYSDSEPAMARAVVNTLLGNFIDDTLGANREGNQNAQNFLRNEINELEVELTSAEQQLADFKRTNIGKMPGREGDYFERLQTEMEDLETTRSHLRQANRRRSTLRDQLTGGAELSASNGSTPQSEIDQRITENERNLDYLQLRYTELHPDVIAVKATLEQLREQKQEQLDQLLESDGVGIVSDNPVIQNIQIELANVNVGIATLLEMESTHVSKIDELQEMVDVLPQIEAGLARLNRDYDVKLAQYRSLLQRLEVAELSQAAELSENVKFQIIDPPRLPTEPAAPGRPILLVLVLLLGLGAGGVVAFMGNMLNPVFSESKLLRQTIGLPVLGTILNIDTIEERLRKKIQIRSFGSVLALLFVSGILVIWFHDPGSNLVRSVV